MDYKETLNLPRTGFSMRAKLPQREPEWLRRWEEEDLYGQMRRRRRGRPRYILHDGPPYANGDIHMGTALNKVLKDMIIKYRTMQGFDCPYVPGWDTHGLPIEHQIIKTRGINRREVPDLEFRRMCREYALEYVSIQREQFKRLGVGGDWEQPYLTLKPAYEARQIEVFGAMAEKGYIYKGLKPVFWCAGCETALAEAEIEYADHHSASIYVRFPVVQDADRGVLGKENVAGTYCLIWTTTPWTIPANLAIAVHPQYDYVLAEHAGDRYLVAAALLENLAREIPPEWKELRRFKGADLEGVRCRHPLFERESPLILGDHVTLDQGTGCVHTAPGHGHEDFIVGRAYGLPVLNPIDGRGCFTAAAGEFAGLHYTKGNRAVVAALEREAALVAAAEIVHQYPHCWRCKKPVLYRSTEQWFASIDGFREATLRAIGTVKWTPPWGEERMRNMVLERQEWCISRQRVWGVPIPIFYCNHCGEPVFQQRAFAAVRDLFAREGSDAWFAREAAEILPPGFACPACGKSGGFTKEKDTMDVWFDSGSSHVAVCEDHPDLRWPADLYLEGSDQYRGWFQSSLLTAVATRGEPPYREVLSHGWVVDGAGKKMSKSLGNVIFPEEIIRRYGADILRLWVSSADFTSDVHISPDILGQLSEVYRKIRNTCRFMLGNCYDFEISRDSVSYSDLEEIDRWALCRLAGLIEKVTGYFESYEYHQVFHALHNFCVIDLSNFYFDILKDRLYCSRAADPERRSAQTVLALVLENLTLLMAPILAFTAEEIWRTLPGRESESVHLAAWPVVDPAWKDEALERRWERLREVREEVTPVLELARRDKVIGSSLEAAVTVWADESLYEALEPYAAELAHLFITSSAILRPLEPESATLPAAAVSGQKLPLAVLVEQASGHKCPRCWTFTPTGFADGLCRRCAAVTGA